MLSISFRSDTKFVCFLSISNKIVPGTVILFDEFYNYPNYKDYEYRAFEDFIKSTGLGYRWLAHTESPVDWNGNQVALVIV